MKYPENATLPFFAYGAFRKGELAFLRIRPFVDGLEENCKVAAEVRVRDGLLLLKKSNSKTVSGQLIKFKTAHFESAYAAIAELEPGRQYKWSTLSVETSRGNIEANVLIGRNVESGSSIPDRDLQNIEDPFFNEALNIVEESISQFSSKEGLGGNLSDMTNFLHLQMAYMLLWSSIERYVSLRYSLGDQVTSKVLSMADEPTFKKELCARVKRTDTLYAANEPSAKGRKVLNAQKAKKSLEYYYQVRCNITHRGKGAFDDFDRLRNSLIELSAIFRACQAASFEEAKTLPATQ